ncbi:2-iminobutanoate/2-iminopropanoate deaminase-like [Cucurbita pepo subsp. pepo]|uniref:2-iminobutanoate/2-iminopropanoate deaminase-like n=1 Tax=Cucurbita pepo subsp. pepo TaxID=3664 RepID=UPI000C9D9499|nr:2-iminobutanoate/2-iminopropanoate deaminase-like [Cucurbita pepo subsp. pepo]
MAYCTAHTFQIPASNVISRPRTVTPSVGAAVSLWRRPSSIPSISNRNMSFKCHAISECDDITPIATEEAPEALGPYSQGIIANNFIFVSGSLGLIPETGELISDHVGDQTEQALKNIGAILKAGGVDYNRVVKTTIMLADVADFALVNEIYAKYFSEYPAPARSTFQAGALPKNAKIEIDAIAVV